MIEFINESKQQDNTKSVLTANQAVDSTLLHFKLDPDKFEIAILACDDEKIRQLNFKFRGINNKTNILSWPEKDLSPKVSGTMPMKPEPINREPVFLGNLAISFEFIGFTIFIVVLAFKVLCKTKILSLLSFFFINLLS